MRIDAELRFSPTKPDGTPRKQMDVRLLIGLGWQGRIGLEVDIAQAYRWFLDHHAEARL